jgi:hypothetical protein
MPRSGYSGRKRLLSRAGKDPQSPRHRIGAGCAGRSQGSEQMVEPQIPLSGGARLGDEIGALAKVLSMADQLERPKRLRRCELRLRGRATDRLGVSLDIQRLDRYDVTLDSKGAEQQVGEAGRFLGRRIGAPILGYITRDPGEGARRGVHHLIHSRRWCEQASEVAHRQLDPIEDLGKWRQLTQLGQSPK